MQAGRGYAKMVLPEQQRDATAGVAGQKGRVSVSHLRPHVAPYD